MAQDMVWLQRSASGFVVSSEGLREHIIPTRVLQRSLVLQTAFSSTNDGDRESLDLSPSLFRCWLEFALEAAGAAAGSEAPDKPSLLRLLKACDFLDDQEGLRQACHRLAALVFPLLTEAADADEAVETTHADAAVEGEAADEGDAAEPWGAQAMQRRRALKDAAHGRRATQATEVVEALPEHLALLVLRAAAARVPPLVNKQGRRQLYSNMVAWHGLLPEPLQPLLLRAVDPSLDTHHALTLPLIDVSTAGPIMRTISRAFGGHLTSLTLERCDFPMRITDDGTPIMGASNEGSDLTYDALKPLIELTALQCLQLDGLKEERSRPWQNFFFALMQCALTHMPHLTRLRMSGGGAGADGQVASKLSHLSTLRALCSLDLTGFGLFGTGAVVANLASVLPMLRSLTHLSLSYNVISSDGWLPLAGAAAGLPLESLDLSTCMLDHEFQFFPHFTADGPQPFPRLRILNLSHNSLSDLHGPSINEIALLPRLEQLLLTECRLPEETERRVLRAVRAADLEVLRLGSSLMPLQTAELLRNCIERWPKLRALEVVCVDAMPHVLSVLSPLAACCALQELHLECLQVKGAEEVVGLAQLTALTQLNLSYVVGGMDVVSALRQSVSALTMLRAAEIVYVPREFEAEVGVEFAEAVCPLTQLTRLSLRCCCLGRMGTRRLAQGLVCMPGMRDLSLVQNRIKPKTFVAAVVPVLSKLSMLSMLSVAKNPLGDAGADALATVLPRMRALRELDLQECSLTDRHNSAVVEAAPPGMLVLNFHDGEMYGCSVHYV